MDLALDMNSEPLFQEEFCCFDGKENRTRNFTTLTASVYHPLLQKQIALATMECRSEDSVNVGKFWRLFNQALKNATVCEEKFEPIGWVTDMASANLNGLAMVYGEDVLNKAKGCEFHFKKSVNTRKAIFPEHLQPQFLHLTDQLLRASTLTAYAAQHDAICDFLGKNGGGELSEWLSWWHDRRHVMFRAFTGFDKPRSNLAEVVHASWVNRGQVCLLLHFFIPYRLKRSVKKKVG